MFIGRKREVKAKQYRKPEKLKLVNYFEHFYNGFEDFSIDRFDEPINSIKAHPLFENTFIIAGNNIIEKRTFFDSIRTGEIKCRIEKYANLARNFFSVNFRKDSQVFCCGTNKNEVYIFPANKNNVHGSTTNSIKKPLKVIKNLKGKERNNSTIRLVGFLGEPSFGNKDTHELYYGNEAGYFRIVNVLRDDILFEHKFNDYIRAGTTNQENVVSIGSYDGVVKVFDTRMKQEVGTIIEDSPIESLNFGSGRHQEKLLVCSNRFVKIYDLRKLGKESSQSINQINLHKKTIVSFDKIIGKENMFLSSGIDCCSKIFDLESMKIKKSFTFGSPILLSAMDSSLNYFCLTNNRSELIYSHHSKKKKKKVKLYKDEEDLITENYKNLINFNLIKQMNKINNKVFKRNEIIQKKYGKQFNKFEYKKILLDSIRNKEEPIIVISIIQELKNRNELTNAIDARNEDELRDILYFIYKNLDNEPYLGILLSVFNLILQYYSGIIGKSKKVDNLLRLIRLKLNKRINDSLELQKLKGLLDILMISNLKK